MMKLRKIAIIGTLMLATSTVCFCQDLTYGQLHDFMPLNWNKEANDTIYCDEFFQILDTVTANYFVTYDCDPYPGLQDYRQLYDILKNPDSIDTYDTSGKVFVSVLIDTVGNLYCYNIKTELGERFVEEAKRILKEMKFVKARCSDINKAYHFTFPIKVENSMRKN